MITANVEYPCGTIIHMNKDKGDKLRGLSLNFRRPVRVDIFGEPSDQLLKAVYYGMDPEHYGNVFVHN